MTVNKGKKKKAKKKSAKKPQKAAYIMASHGNNFDLLRLIAAFLVIFYHCFRVSMHEYMEPIFTTSRGYLNVGTIGLYIFFLISGYLITESFTKRPKHYFRNRILRVFPALATVVLLSAFVLGPLVSFYSADAYFSNKMTYVYLVNMFPVFSTWLLPGVFYQNPTHVVNMPLWSLSGLIVLYAVFFLIGKSKVKLNYAMPLLFVAATATYYLCIKHWAYYIDGFYLVVMPDMRMVSFFALGSCFYLFQKRIRYNPEILLALMIFSVAFYLYHMPNIAAFLLLPYAVFFFAFSKRFKFHKAAKYGDFSYGLFLYTFPVQQLIYLFTGGQISIAALLVLSLAGGLACAYASWHLVEKCALTGKKH